ncbi:uncharacterized protein LOC141677120 [Apium graveolens]|uniref:uncharacterized protein LOC141677120 n=1 Tax=Apium graveolens TaxID=4045 RepID=UPI003D78D792
MMALSYPTHLTFNLPNQILQFKTPSRICKTTSSSVFLATHFYPSVKINFTGLKVITRACSDGGGDEIDASTSYDIRASTISPSTSGDEYVALFVRMLGLDNDPLDRDQAVVALWKYSLGGKQYIDTIMRFRGSINLIVNLLKSESTSTCEAAAGLLRTISTVNAYRDIVAESGAIEEIFGLLRRSSLASDVKEQSLCTLCNLSVDEKFRSKIVHSDLLSILIKLLEDEDIKVAEAAGGVVANLALSHSNHKIMVEAGVIPKLAKLLKTDAEGSKVIRKEAKNVLLELAKDDFYKILVMEEGLVIVPLIGTAAYKSFRPALHSWPSLPDGTEIKQSSKGPSKFGASELLLGLNVQDKNSNLEEAKMNAIVGRTQQHFLARIGAIELDDQMKFNGESASDRRVTVLPWMDGVARLTLILTLEDESAVARAAEAIADASISEHMRVSFKEAGAVKHLIQLVDHQNSSIRLAAIHALDRLSLSTNVCQRIEAEGVLYPLINFLKNSEIPGRGTDMILNILNRILDPSREMKFKFYDGPVNGSKRVDAKENIESAQNGEEIGVPTSTRSLKNIHLEYTSDSAFLVCLVEILKTSAPVSQRKAASIFEFMAVDMSSMEKITSVDIASGLDAVFKQSILNGIESNFDHQQPELHALQVEEAGQAISAASRLLTRLLDSDKFCQSINSLHFTRLLREILQSSIPLHNKDWVAACLVKLSSLSGPYPGFEDPINREVTLYETVPRLIQQIKSSYSPEIQEASVIELNRIISEGVVNSSRAVALEGGIFPLVKLIEEGTDRAAEAGLAILYNLSMESENHSAIISAGAVPILRRIVLSQRPQWTRALHVLRTLPSL